MDAIKDAYVAASPTVLGILLPAFGVFLWWAYREMCAHGTTKAELAHTQSKLKDAEAKLQNADLNPHHAIGNGVVQTQSDGNRVLPDGCDRILATLGHHDGIPDSSVVERTGLTLLIVQHHLEELRRIDYVIRKRPRQTIEHGRAVQPPDLWFLAQRGRSYLLEHPAA